MKNLPLYFAVGILGMLCGLYFTVPSFQNFLTEAFDVLTSDNQARINKWVGQFGLWGPVVLIVIMVVQMFLFVVPNIFLMMVAIVSYGPVWGSVISFIGIFASSSLGYVIGRYLGPKTVEKFLGPQTQTKVADFVKDYGFTAIAITRLSSLSNDSLSIVAGLLKMRYQKYILATLSGITPLIVLLAIYGDRGNILKALIWIAGISLVLLVLYIVLDRKKKRRVVTRDTVE
ncbi:MAG: TVP38/TMEM64 family protein [Pedobacter sp.]|nr:MAG: TVP38/TMEM64 family protein [Pedobacter sp.]